MMDYLLFAMLTTGLLIVSLLLVVVSILFGVFASRLLLVFKITQETNLDVITNEEWNTYIEDTTNPIVKDNSFKRTYQPYDKWDKKFEVY